MAWSLKKLLGREKSDDKVQLVIEVVGLEDLDRLKAKMEQLEPVLNRVAAAGERLTQAFDALGMEPIGVQCEPECCEEGER